MKTHVCFGVIFMGALVFGGPVLAQQKMVISVPVANLWVEPDPAELNQSLPPLPLFSKNLPHLDTQLLFGERVLCLQPDEGNGWIRVRALEQPACDRRTGPWGFIEGWIYAAHARPVDRFSAFNAVVDEQWAPLCADAQGKSLLAHLSLGTALEVIGLEDGYYRVLLADGTLGFVCHGHVFGVAPEIDDLDRLRDRVACLAVSFALRASPYCWGGRSAHNKEAFGDVDSAAAGITSVDCSGLVSLAFRARGLLIPRNAHDQYLRAIPVAPQDLKPGDLIFLKSQGSNFQRVIHVMMYLGSSSDDELLIEAMGADDLPIDARCTRIISVQERFGVPLKSIEQGTRVGNRQIHYGTFFSSQAQAQALREAFLTIPQVH